MSLVCCSGAAMLGFLFGMVSTGARTASWRHFYGAMAIGLLLGALDILSRIA